MPFTTTYTGITLQTVDDFIPEETYLTLSDALAEYGLSTSETVVLTDSDWKPTTMSPTSGTCILSLSSLSCSAVFICTKNSTTNNLPKYSSVPNGSIYLNARWSDDHIEIRAVNNTASLNIVCRYS